MEALMLVSNAVVSDARTYTEARSLVQTGYEGTVTASDREEQDSSYLG
jgi:hypothetical protein